MNVENLRTIQEPLKAAYRQDPESAIVILRAKALALDGVACRLDTGRALLEEGLHPSAGGDGSQACSGDMLLQALVACAGVTLSAVANSFGARLRKAEVFAEGELDFRGGRISRVAPALRNRHGGRSAYACQNRRTD